MSIQKLLREKLNVLYENKQLADKIYFKSGLLDNFEMELILRISNGDETTKTLCDFLMQMKKRGDVNNTTLKLLHFELVNYNKNVLPIKGFEMYNKIGINYSLLEIRSDILKLLKKLPSTAIRNLKGDLRVERDFSELSKYFNSLEYFITNLSLLDNRKPEQVKKVMNKMFKNKVTLNDLINFVGQKENLLGGADFTRDEIIGIIEEEYLEIVFDKDNLMVVKVDSVEGIKAIGCNSLWCFTYGNSHENWNNYSYNNIVYAIIDFSEKSDSEEFMYVYIKPLPTDYDYDYDEDDGESPIFNMSNDNFVNPLHILEKIGPNFREIMNFDAEQDDDDYTESEVFEFDEEILSDELKKHKLHVGGEYEIDKGQLLKIIKVIPNDETYKYYINIGDKQGIVTLERLLNFIHNYQIFN